MNAPLAKELAVARGTPCECLVCRRHREIDAIKERGDPEEMRTLITDLLNELIESGEELSIERANKGLLK